MKTQKNPHAQKEGAVLATVVIVLLLITFLVLVLIRMSLHNARETSYEMQSAQAFWLAEAGVHRCVQDLKTGGNGQVADQLNTGAFVTRDMNGDRTTFVSTGTVLRGAEKAVSRSIRIVVSYIAAPFEDVIHGANRGGERWDLMMRGTQYNGNDGPRVPGTQGGNYPGGNDVAIGNVDVNGGVRMYGESKVEAVPLPNIYEVFGDVSYSQGLYAENGDATHIAGSTLNTSSTDYDPPNLADMNYAGNCDWNVSAEFEKYKNELVADSNDGGWRLPANHSLHDIVVKRNNSSTTGDDYYFEPRSMTMGKTYTAESLIILGDNKTYYVDGHVWFRSMKTYGFKIDGQAVIVSTGDIHIGDNLAYRNRTREAVNGNPPDMLALVALGQLNSVSGIPYSGGDVYFGDPDTGTLYTCDAFMFANNNFFYNTSINGQNWSKQQPESGFKVFGNFMAMNQVVVKRDWYRDDSTGRYYPAELVEVTGSDGSKTWEWVDSREWADGKTTLLSDREKNSIRHYAMQVEYDDRIRDIATEMNGLPRGKGSFVAGHTWQEATAH